MAKTSKVVLRVREADEADYDKPVIRIHKANKPQGIKWGDHVNISLDSKHWITCKLEPAGDIGTGKIYMGIHLRTLLNKDALGTQIAQIEAPCNFYIRRASSRKLLLYITIGIIATIVAASLVYSLGLTGCQQ